MKKLTLFSLIIVSAIALSGCKYINNDKTGNNNANTPGGQNLEDDEDQKDYSIREGEVVLFWGKGCPHCENIDKFLAENNGLAEKLNLKKIEVFEDLKGQRTFMKKVLECKLDYSGVPLLYKNDQCFQGDTPVIEELKKNL